MGNGNISLNLLNDVFDLIERTQSLVMLTNSEKEEITNAVLDAVIETESVFGKNKSRKIIQNDDVGMAWSKAGRTIIKYLPNENIGIWLQNKGEAWVNPNKWDSETLEKNNLKIEQIKERITKIVSTRRKFNRPKNI